MADKPQYLLRFLPALAVIALGLTELDHVWMSTPLYGITGGKAQLIWGAAAMGNCGLFGLILVKGVR